MPTYEYRCKSCGHELEAVQSFTDDALTECPACGGPLRKVFGSIGITFKGWASTRPTPARARSVVVVVHPRQRRRRQGRARRRSPRRPTSSKSDSVEEATAAKTRVRARRRASTRLDVGFDLGGVIGVFGGSGFTRFLDAVETLDVDTPYGPTVRARSPSATSPAPAPPSSPATATTTGSRRTGCRTGRTSGRCARSASTRCIGPFAAGSLPPACTGRLRRRRPARRPHVGPTRHLLRRVHRRSIHITFADPYGAELRGRARGRRDEARLTVHDGGTVVVIQGPRFATRAESAYYRAQGWSVINMTQYPEAALARELGLCYATVALVTDYDTGVEGDDAVPPVTQEEVFAEFDRYVGRLRDLLVEVIPGL